MNQSSNIQEEISKLPKDLIKEILEYSHEAYSWYDKWSRGRKMPELHPSIVKSYAITFVENEDYDFLENLSTGYSYVLDRISFGNKIVEVLLRNGDFCEIERLINKDSNFYLTCGDLEDAVIGGNFAALKSILLNSCGESDEIFKNYYPSLSSVNCGFVEVTPEGLHSHLNHSSYILLALERAVSLNDPNMIEFFLDRFPSLKKYVFICAAKYSNLSMTKKYFIDNNAIIERAIIDSCYSDNLKILNFLYPKVQHGLDFVNIFMTEIFNKCALRYLDYMISRYQGLLNNFFDPNGSCYEILEYVIEKYPGRVSYNLGPSKKSAKSGRFNYVYVLENKIDKDRRRKEWWIVLFLNHPSFDIRKEFLKEKDNVTANFLLNLDTYGINKSKRFFNDLEYVDIHGEASGLLKITVEDISSKGPLRGSEMDESIYEEAE